MHKRNKKCIQTSRQKTSTDKRTWEGKISAICQSYVSVSDTYCVSAGSSRLSAVFLIINAALGAGLLNFPQAFDQAGGIMTAIIVQAVSSCNRLITKLAVYFVSGRVIKHAELERKSFSKKLKVNN
jgi:hypothetical protein